MIALVELGTSNVGSVRHALARVGCSDPETCTPASIGRASAIILPGVGAFGDAMASLREQELVEPLRQAVGRGVPLLGICLGMQLLARQSEEHGLHEGLGLIDGRVERLSPSEPGFRVPNIGWCDVQVRRTGALFDSEAAACFYHVHSYHLVPDDSGSVAATTAFSGQDVVVAIERENLLGVQFHPEKSQDDGLELLSRFVRLATPSP